MEIIHLILGKANPQRMNGVNKVVYQLASRQQAAGKAVSVWGITSNPIHDYGQRNFKTVLFKTGKGPFGFPEKLKDAIGAVKGKAVFHLHGGWIPIFSRISALLDKLDIPFVLTPHGAYNTIAMRKSRMMKKVYFQLLEKKLMDRAQKIHCIGKSEVKGMGEIYPHDKAFLLPYGFDLEEKENLRELTDNSRSKFIVGFLGRIDIYTKGIDLLIQAFKEFRKETPEAKLWIIGDSSELSKVRQMLALNGLANHAICWGAKYGAEKMALLDQMDAFSHPSRNEGLPSAALEAASRGVPLLVSQATNLGEYVEQYKCGVVVPDNDVESLIQGLKRLHVNWKKKFDHEMRENAINMVKTIFDWQQIVEHFDRLYQATK